MSQTHADAMVSFKDLGAWRRRSLRPHVGLEACLEAGWADKLKDWPLNQVLLLDTQDEPAVRFVKQKP